jgi:hypothetical protein
MTESTAISIAKKSVPKIAYNEQITQEICYRLANGESLLSICRTEGFPSNFVVWKWRKKHPEFDAAYVEARTAQAEHFADELIDIADDPRNIDSNFNAWSRLRLSERKWSVERIMHKDSPNPLVVVNNQQNNVTITSTDPVAVSQEYRKIIDG